MDSRDYAVLALYFAFMLALGFVFRRFSKNTSDYFRGGGTMLWWLAGPSGMMAALSAWSFTGAAGEIYETGPLIVFLYASNATSLVLVYFFTCERFRRMRVVTYVEAIRRRFGENTGQFYLWATLPIGLLFSGIQLYAVSIFFSAVFHTSVPQTIITLSSVVIFMAMLGGSWAIVVGDFLQLLLIMLVLAVSAFYALRAPEIGGLIGLWQKAPPAFFHWSQIMRPEIIVLWAVGTFVNSLVDFNNIGTGAARFLFVKDGTQAKRAALSMIGFFCFIIVFLFIPPMVSAVMLPDLRADYSQLPRPNDAAFVAICLKTMPHGVIGLLAAGIFAVAMAAMDTGLNRNVGIFIRNFYSTTLRPQAGEKELLFSSKICTVLFGLIVMSVAWWILGQSGEMSLFSLLQKAVSIIQFPIYMPLVLGIFIRRGPTWAGWTTALLGIATALAIKPFIFPLVVAATHWSPLSPRESARLDFGLTIMAVAVVQVGWYSLVRYLSPSAGSRQAQDFFRDLDRPIDVATEMTPNDGLQYSTVSTLCLVYGAAIAAFALMPNSLEGRLSFLFCGLVILAIGGALRRQAVRIRHEAAPAPDVQLNQLSREK